MNNSFENAETTYKIETTDRKEMQLMLNALNMSLALYDIDSWKRNIYNGKDYDGHVIYKNKMYTKEEWYRTKLPDDEYNEDHTLKERPVYCYTENDVINKLDYLMREVQDFIFQYYER